MAYQIYITDAIVCGTYRRNTADATYALLTAEAGMVYATARSVREERSRQRYALQDFAAVRVSLVRGKQGWRIGSVESIENFYHCATTRAQRGAVVRVIKVVRRFVQAEGMLPSVFTCTHAVLTRLANASDVDSLWLVRRFELWLLYELGYVSPAMIPEQITLTTAVVTWASAPTAVELKVDTVLADAMAASQL